MIPAGIWAGGHLPFLLVQHRAGADGTDCGRGPDVGLSVYADHRFAAEPDGGDRLVPVSYTHLAVIDRLEHAVIVAISGNHDPQLEGSAYRKIEWSRRLYLAPPGVGRVRCV